MRLYTVVAVAFAVVLLAPATAFAAADLAITFSDTPDPLPEEGQVDYNLTVTNNGPDPATGVQVAVPEPPASIFSFVSGSLSQGSISFDGTTVLYTFGTIANGNTVTGTSRWSGDHPGTGGSTPTLTATSADPNASNNSASVSTTVVGLTAGDAGFGDQGLGTIGPAKPILVTNGSNQSVSLPASLPVSGQPDDFLGMRGCGGLTLAAGASCTLTARFAPSVLGDRAALVTLAPTAGPVDPFGLNLTGRGVAPPPGPPGPPGPGRPAGVQADRRARVREAARPCGQARDLRVRVDAARPRQARCAEAIEARRFGHRPRPDRVQQDPLERQGGAQGGEGREIHAAADRRKRRPDGEGDREGHAHEALGAVLDPTLQAQVASRQPSGLVAHVPADHACRVRCGFDGGRRTVR